MLNYLSIIKNEYCKVIYSTNGRFIISRFNCIINFPASESIPQIIIYETSEAHNALFRALLWRIEPPVLSNNDNNSEENNNGNQNKMQTLV